MEVSSFVWLLAVLGCSTGAADEHSALQPIADGWGPGQPLMIHPAVPPNSSTTSTPSSTPSSSTNAVLGALLEDGLLGGGRLGDSCDGDGGCVVPNAACRNSTCDCADSFIADPLFPDSCRLAPGYGESCGPDGACRQPFTCNGSGRCDCPKGTIQEFFQCLPDCPAGMVNVGGKCVKAVLGDTCSASEECVQSYASCLHGECQCIPGANQFKGACFPVNQCPLGEAAKDKRGAVQHCKVGSSTDYCPDDYYCLYAEFSDSAGFCCPKIKMNCPIGQPLAGYNCSSCPWDTHHCFSYVIGSYTETMCCPNACPSARAIQTGGRCYPRAAFGGHCDVDEQCYSVQGATCRAEAGRAKRCRCPRGAFRNHVGKCIRESRLGQACAANEECVGGTNTVCVEGTCDCYQGYMPRPDEPKPTSCIAEPSCPAASGIVVMRDGHTNCAEDAGACKPSEFCRRWWIDAENSTFALCCPKPTRVDLEAVCQPFRLELLLGLGTTSGGKAVGDGASVPCDLSPVLSDFRFRDSVGVAEGGRPSRLCPPGATCLFNPFSVNEGLCCAQPQTPEEEGEEAEVYLVEAAVEAAEKDNKIKPTKAALRRRKPKPRGPIDH